ncbi:MAG: hypothetical protein V2B20_19290 [Pseudomonadota bacterium]
MKPIYCVLFLALTALSCAVLKDPSYQNFNQEKADYRFVIISKRDGGIRDTGYYNKSGSGFYPSYNNLIDPNTVIRGLLLKKGYSEVSEATDDIIAQTLLVRHWPSGERIVFGGNTLEVTIEIIAAKTSHPVFKCTAEGIGQNEADDIREATTRCLDGFPVASISTSVKGDGIQRLDQKEPTTNLKAAIVSPFSRIEVGMSINHVQDLIGKPSDAIQYSTGKSNIPFYYGSDRTRLEVAYIGQGRITYTGNPWTVYRIIHNPHEPGYYDKH